MVGGLDFYLPLNPVVCWNSSFGYGIYLPARKLIDYLDEYSFISVSITSNHPHIDFKCGARKVNVEDLTEFRQVIDNDDPHLGSSTEDYLVVSCQSDRNIRRKRDLESLLLGLYQGDWVKNHKYDYIIPYISVPAWFLNHRFCSSTRIRLPENSKFDERCMGIAVCAYYTVDKQLAGSDNQKDLTSFLCFYNSLPSHQIRLTRHKVFQDSQDIFVDSSSTHRILVYYIPQMSFRLRGCSHIGASFEPKNPGVQVKECGIRIVYEQNVKEFVQTLVRMRQPMPNIAEHCTSPESFSNPQIDVGTSRNFSPSVTGFLIPTRKVQHGSIMSSESSIKACLQKNCEDGEILHGYSAEREIPQWFRNQTNGYAVEFPQPQELCNDPDLMGLALCGLFHFTSHPTAVRKNLDSRTFNPLRFKCILQTSSSPMRSVCNGLLSECNEHISLIQRSFIWVLFIPYTAHSHLWSQSTWFKFWFTSTSPDLSVESCGINIVYRQNMEELTRIMARYSITSPFDWFLDNSSDSEIFYMWDNFPEIFIEATSSSEYLHPQRLFISQGDTSVTAQYSYNEDDPFPDNQFRYFHPSTLYNFCFPTRRTLKWFNHQSRGYSISIDITSNLYDDSNWMGLALYASFSIDKDGTNFENTVSISSPHFLYCQFELSSASLDQIHCCRIDGEEQNWLSIQYGFNWISYIPGEAFKDMLNQCDHMKASFVSDLPGVIVQKCGLRLLHKHDELQFERELQYCYTLISRYRDFTQWLLKQPVISERTETTGKITSVITAPSKQLDLDGCFEYFGCFPLVDILPFFSSQSNEPSVTINVPRYFYNDIDWTGLVLCANFSIQEHQTAILENPNSTISHHLICLLETDVAGPEHLLIHLTNNEEFMWLDTDWQFLWLSCISRELLSDEFNQCGCIKASIISDWPGVMVQKCGLSFFHVNDNWFRMMRSCCEREYLYRNIVNQVTARKLKMKQDHDDETGPRRASSSNEIQIHHEITRMSIDKGETSEAKDQHCHSNLLDFDHSLVHNFCFLKSEILDWFSNESDSPSLTVQNLCSDNTWIGFALYACFEFNENQNSILDILDSEGSYNLICHLETKIGSVKPRHIYCPTKKDLMLLQLGGFIWFSYIPPGSLPDWLNHCIHAKFSFATNCPGLTVQKCGLHPLYKHTVQECSLRLNKLCEITSKEILTHNVKLLSDNWNIFWNLTNTNKRKQKHDNEAGPSTRKRRRV
nr:hypothetical protein CFP56_35518 [Quercus suber]